MAREANGMHIENNYVNHAEADRNAIVGRYGCITVLDLQVGQVYPRIRAHLGPDVFVHVRAYTPNWYTLNPEDWARRNAENLRQVPGLLQDRNVGLTSANEQDLACEGHPQAATWDRPHPSVAVWDEIWSWGERHDRAFLAAASDSVIALGTNPPAGGHEPAGYPPDWEFQLGSFKRYLACVPRHRRFIAWHAYAQPDWTGTRPDNGGYWYGIRPARPGGYREQVQGLPPVGGIADPGGVMVQYPDYPCLGSEWGTWTHHDARAVAVQNTLRAFDEAYSWLSKMPNFLGLTPFIWDSGDEHWQNRIRPNAALVEGLKRMKRYTACDWPFVGGEKVDRIEVLLTDMWNRQGVKPAKGADAFWAYALEQARKGRVIVPQASKDGNYYNSDDPKYVVAYTLPAPLWCEKNVWVVHEGFPPF